MSKHGRIKRKKDARRIARERMDILFELAREAKLSGEEERARRYVWLLRRIGMRYNVSVPRRYKIYMCKGCNSFLISGSNARVRLDKSRIRVHCLSCGQVRRYPLGYDGAKKPAPRNERDEKEE
ncbi:MAG: hypothetical protein QCI38_01115 [Candidatus Thermoplasmatota archaeon]|nr:hypothetical protein [Candidatus Thermoplasmatota archaeon]